MMRLKNTLSGWASVILFSLAIIPNSFVNATSAPAAVSTDCHSYAIGVAEAVCDFNGGCSISEFYSIFSINNSICEINQWLNEQ